jgi:hypothetical protein
MFKDYNSYKGYLANYGYTDEVSFIVSTDLYEINYMRVDFSSRAEVSFLVNENEFDKIIQANNFTIYYPRIIFDDLYQQKLIKENFCCGVYKCQSSMLTFYSLLSSKGLSHNKKECDIVIDKLNKEKEEAKKPINKLKRLFGM